MITFVQVLLGSISILAFCRLSYKININKVHRGRQFLMPFIALIYCVVLVIGANKFYNLLENLYYYIKRYFIILDFLPDFNWEKYAIYIFNCVIATVFATFKGIVLPVLNNFWKSSKLMNSTSGYFYQYETDIDKWLLKPGYSNMRNLFKWAYYISMGVTIVVFALSRMYQGTALFIADFYPVCTILVLGELTNYLDGVTKTEFIESILFEDESNYSVANYGILRKILRGLFNDYVLFDNTWNHDDDASTTHDFLAEMSNSEDVLSQRIGEYFIELKENGQNVDINYVHSTINLLRGTCTLINNPFYRDLTNYIILPLTKALMQYKKCLIIVSRDSIVDDVKDWLDTSIDKFTGTKSLWKTGIIESDLIDADIAIMRYCDINNQKIQKANKEFLNEVGFVFLIEPSHIVSTAQIGLSLLADQCGNGNKKVVYCACDRNCDGLVDTLSHLLKVSITEVTATLNGNCNTSCMYWDANKGYMQHKLFTNISRYLGIGTEICSVALKYQVPDVHWLGSEKFPVIDMKWIAGQYYKPICDYADFSLNQEEFNKRFDVDANLWKFEQQKNTFIVVEDEFQNLFEMTRVFSSRANKQGFMNVISNNYLLRDYMIDNADVFQADPKAIPTIVPDYARSERNILLKLMLKMMDGPISKKYIENEFILGNIEFTDVIVKLKELFRIHFNINNIRFRLEYHESLNEGEFSVTKEEYYDIASNLEVNELLQKLKNAYYLAEDEKGEYYHIGAKLYGHVYQSFLPGQFMTFEGKYYEIQTITQTKGVVTRRASDHIMGRNVYRQLRKIDVNNWTDSEEIGSKITIDDIEIAHGYMNYSVETKGYLDMTSSDDLNTAKTVLVSGIPTRNYHMKGALKIKLPESDERIRYTICVLLNEMFMTTYPKSYEYISANVVRSEELEGLLYEFGGEIDPECIYIIEDSEVDLGLVVSVERNLRRYFGIIYDYLKWHQDKLNEVVVKEHDPEEVTYAYEDFPEVEEEKVGFFKRVWRGIRNFFKKVKKFFSGDRGKVLGYASTMPNMNDQDSADTATSQESQEPVNTVEETQEQVDSTESTDVPFDPVEDGQEPVDNVEYEEEQVDAVEEVHQETAYQMHNYLKFGSDDYASCFDFEGVRNYLEKYGFEQNEMSMVRNKVAVADEIEKTYDPSKFGSHYCDFCGCELLTNYEVLHDGRERCNKCSASVIKSADEFRELYKSVAMNMEVYYGIQINKDVKVKMTDAKKIAEALGEKFVATSGFDSRAVGFAQKDSSGYTIYIENGSPRISAIATMAHELTHIWQYQNWNEKALMVKYGEKNMLEIYEGMAKWAEIQYLILMNEVSYAKRQEIITRMRQDAYGRGFNKYISKYPLSYETVLKYSPFNNEYPL